MAQRRNLTNPDWMTAMQMPSMMTPKGHDGADREPDADADDLREDPQTARRRLMPIMGEMHAPPSTIQQVLDLLRAKVG